ncbi:hypothetical protein [Roseivirga sp.]|uniref:hypothetical protein n=1 Tax=Roseivirga sp. TaxID=1964215 RepID=UPI003B8D96A3
MNFEEFRIDIEHKLNSIARFELLEFRYEPYHFGNGLLAYRISGRNHRLIYDARENHLTWECSEPHEKYFGAKFSIFKKFDGLNLEEEEIKYCIQQGL